MTEWRFTGARPTMAAAPMATRETTKAASVIIGYAVVFNVEAVIGGYFRERIAPGAFRDALGRDDVRGLFNHDKNWILGRTAAGTLRLAEDATGLRYEIAVNADDPLARSVAAKVTRGDVSGSSFAFFASEDDERWTFDKRQVLPLRTIYRATLFDVSPVTFPAYVTTTAHARSARQAIDQAKAWRLA